MGAKQDKTDTRKKEIIKAMENCHGFVSDACRLAGVNRNTYYDYYMKDPAFKEAVDDIREANIDFAENQLFKLIKGVEIEDTEIFVYQGKVIKVPVLKKYAPCKTSIIFYLKTIGKNRGYIETKETITTNKVDPFEGMTEAEIDAAIAEMEKQG